MVKYRKHILKKVKDAELETGSYYEIYRDGRKITQALTYSNAKEFIDTFDGTQYDWNVLC